MPIMLLKLSCYFPQFYNTLQNVEKYLNVDCIVTYQIKKCKLPETIAADW